LFQFTPPVTDDDFKGTPLLVIQPRNSKFQGPRPPVKRKSSAMQGESTELTNIAFSSVVVYGTSITLLFRMHKFYTVFIAKLEFPFIHMSWGRGWVYPLRSQPFSGPFTTIFKQ